MCAIHKDVIVENFKPREKKYRILLIKMFKDLYKIWNYYNLYEMTRTILYLKYGRWEVEVEFICY